MQGGVSHGRPPNMSEGDLHKDKIQNISSMLRTCPKKNQCFGKLQECVTDEEQTLKCHSEQLSNSARHTPLKISKL